jgi:hypothetical protein
MKVRIVQSAVIRGFPGVKVGDVIEMTDPQAAEVVGMQLGVEFKGDSPAVETREPEVEHRDPHPLKKAKKQH